jgi:hypothetical protein
MSAVNHVNRVNDVIDVKNINLRRLRRRFGCSSACGGVSVFVRLRRRFGVRPPAAAFRGYAACGGGFL